MDVGEKLGKYEIRGTLGRGAMGVVYDGWDPLIDRRVAIKTVRMANDQDEDAEQGLARFRREAQAAGRMQHPNVVAVYDYGETPEFAYLVMEFVDGRSLKSALDANERFPMAEVARLMGQLLEALQFSHNHGVIHRDIKPANVILTRGGNVKVADFGVARIESSSMTQVGTVLGTPAYMSPEQLAGQPVDARSDIYSAGVVLYQLLTGDRPYHGTNFTSIYHQALNSDPIPPSKLAVTVPPAFDAVVARAMAKRPQDRYAGAAEFAAAIADAATDRPAPPRAALDAEQTIVAAAPPPAPVRPLPAATAKPVRSPSRTPAIAGAAALVLVLAGGGGWYLTRPATRGGTALVAAAPAATPAVAAIAQTTSPPTTSPPTTSRPAISRAEATLPPAPTPAPPVAHAGTAAAVPVRQPPRAEASAAPPQPPPAPPPAATAPATPALPAPTKLALAPVALRSALGAAVAPVDCTLVGGSVADQGGEVRLTGVAGRGLPTTDLHRAIEDAAPAAAIDWRVASFDGPYCRALDVLRPVAAGFGSPGAGLGLALRNGERALVDGEFITLDLTTPDYPSWLQVDYLQHDGTVVHLYPSTKNPARLFEPDSHESLGDPAAGGERWQVGAPYGSDMVIAIASSAPLFKQRRKEFEQTDDYLRALQAALQSAERHDLRMSARAVVLVTKPRR